MGKALYREYRPLSLADVAGQPHITAALARSLESGVVSHAYLFTGPRGVGKTSVARILAHQVNGLPYEQASRHLDIIEIDAASNRGIEDVRELREKATTAPTSAKYKVYIIDEVHMLSTPAFNALLKTLEEPPAHVIFILATTEVHKVPDTIISRTQHYAFRPIAHNSIVAQLRDIAQKESIQIDDEALAVIAEHGNGSFRDSISLLDQVRHSGEVITADVVRSLFGVAPDEAIVAIFGAINHKDTNAMYSVVRTVLDGGVTAQSLASQLSNRLRHDVRAGTSLLSPRESLALLDKLIGVSPSPNPELTLEIILVGVTLVDDAEEYSPKNTLSVAVPMIEKSTQSTAPTPVPKIVIPKAPETLVEVPVPTAHQKPAKKAATNDNQQFDEVWQTVLQTIKKTHHSLYGVLRMAEASIENTTVTLSFRFKLHYSKVNDAKHSSVIAQVLHDVTGREYTIACKLNEEVTATPKAQVISNNSTYTTKDSSALSTISNIFGGGELLES